MSVKDRSSDPQLAIIDHHLSHQMALDYWLKKSTLIPASALLIDWPLLGSALQSWPPTYCIWVSKFASGHSAVGQTMARWKKWDSPLCPFCQLTEETTLHVLQCPHPECTSYWHQSVESLWSWMVSADTSPIIIRCFITTLHTHGIGSLTPLASSSHLPTASAQSEIGFFNMLLGCLYPQWEYNLWYPN